MTALDIISSALRLIGVYASGETLPISEANDALSVFDQMVDSWNADKLAIFKTQSNDFPFISGQQTYKLGAGGDFNMARPARIESLSAIITTNPANPIEVPIAMWDVSQWQTKLPVKAVNSTFPVICYDDGDFPFRNLNFWPIPQANSVRIYSWQPLAAPATLETAVAFPPGYSEAFRYNLAIRLSAEFSSEKPIAPQVVALATESLARVKTMNAPDLTLRSDLVGMDNGQNYRAEMFGLPY